MLTTLDPGWLNDAVLAFRRAMERAAGDAVGSDDHGALPDFPSGVCMTASYYLVHFLHHQLGVPLDLITVRVGGWRENMSHAWLVVDGLIVDITIDQFHDGRDRAFVTNDATWHTQFEGAHDGGFVPPNPEDCTDASFLRTYAFIADRLDPPWRP